MPGGPEGLWAVKRFGGRKYSAAAQAVCLQNLELKYCQGHSGMESACRSFIHLLLGSGAACAMNSKNL
jgi:hypothetical protein